MQFLIVGSKGFIGSHLTEYLSTQGHTVYESDIIIDYEKPNSYFLVDATNADYHSIFESTEIDICVNCSGAASVPDSLKHPYRDFQLNTANIFKLLEAIRSYQPKCNFINLSSAAVYGNPTQLPVKENFEINPISPYGYHKWMSEQIISEFYRFYKLKTCSLRIFSAYGEGLRKQLFWDLYQKTKQSKKLKLWGTGDESRDFIYIRDLVRAILIIAENGKFQGESINIANGQEVAIKDAVDIFYALFKEKLSFEFSGESRPGDPNNWSADITRLKQLGYEQKFTIKNGLENYYKWLIERG